MTTTRTTKTKPKVPQMRGVEDLLSVGDATPTTVGTDKIQINPHQPRRYFDPDKLAQLVASIKQHGILEPLLVRPLNEGIYELIAGERRLRAAIAAGLGEVPIISKKLSDQECRQIALIENLQREDLNPIDETEGILELLGVELGTDTKEVISLLHHIPNVKRRNQKLTENVYRQSEVIESTLATLGKFTAEGFRTSRLPLLNLPTDVLEFIDLYRII